MTFVSPLFLWALAAVAAPVIIHLFNFRKYKKVYFSNVKFLKELQQESKSKSRLKELLVLLCRCLTIIALVLAFAQPVIPTKDGAVKSKGINAVSLYIDNSYSMENVSKQGPLLQIAKAQAKDLVNAFGNLDKFQVITNDFEGKHQRFHTKEDVLNVIEDLKISAAVRPLSDVIKRQTDFLYPTGDANKRIFILSDAQRSTFDLDKIEADSNIRTTLLPLKANQVNNVSLDTCFFESPLQQKGFIQKLHARIKNNGSASVDLGTAKLSLNKQQIAISSFSLEPGSTTEVVFTFENKSSGNNFGSIKIEDYPVTFDDELFFTYASEVNVKVTLINGKEQNQENAFTSLFKSDSIFNLNSFSEQLIDFSAFKKSDVIILNQLSNLSSGLQSELNKFTAQGGVIVLIPSETSDLNTYNTLLTQWRMPSLIVLDTVQVRTDKVEFASRFFNGVFEKNDARINLPLVLKHYRLQKTSNSNFETILALQNSDAFFGTSQVNNGHVYLFTSPLSERSTNFNKHALFVPTFYRISFSSLKSLPLFYPVNANVVFSVKNEAGEDESPPHIIEKNGKADIIPEVRNTNNETLLYTRSQISSPGFYELIKNKITVLPLAFNYSRKESDLSTWSNDELAQIIDRKQWKNVVLIDNTQVDVVKQVMFEAQGKKLWKIFIILALLFIAAEIALLRLLK